MEIVTLIHSLVWGPWLLLLFLGTGVFLTVRLGGFQLLHMKTWWKATVCTLGGTKKDGGSQLATACTALAATVGTGNIAGVATALIAGGPGAIFWMWVSAFLGMASAYSEVYLGILYRRKEEPGRCLSGPFLYLEHGLGRKRLALLAAFFCLLASLGMGSMVQANSISDSFLYAFSLPPLLTGAIVTLLTAAVILGGIGRISQAAARLVPFSAGLYLLLCLLLLLTCWQKIPGVLFAILGDAFDLRSAAGGAAGYGMARALSCGVSRGVFSNEAGLGSLAILHGSAPEDTTPQEQAMWAVFEVFFDTILSCTLTALVILCIGGTGDSLILAGARCEGSALVSACFSARFGSMGGLLTAASMALFAFATIIAWFYLGHQAAVYLTRSLCRPEPFLFLFCLLYLSAVFFGCISKLELVWSLSDIFNGLMAVPNLLGLLLLSRQVKPPKLP